MLNGPQRGLIAAPQLPFEDQLRMFVYPHLLVACVLSLLLIFAAFSLAADLLQENAFERG